MSRAVSKLNILRALRENGPMFGRDIGKAMGKKPPLSLYVMLSSLEDDAVIASWAGAGKWWDLPARREYGITDDGLLWLEKNDRPDVVSRPEVAGT